MPLAGFTAARGDLNVTLVVAAGTARSLLGALLWHWIGQWLGREPLRQWAARHGRWLAISPDEVDQARAWSASIAARRSFSGDSSRLRALISVPASVVEMPLVPFFAYSSVGTALWCGLLAAAGYLLEDQHRKVADWLHSISNVLFGRPHCPLVRLPRRDLPAARGALIAPQQSPAIGRRSRDELGRWRNVAE